MPLSETHRRKRSKNWFALVAISLFVVGLYYLTILKMGGR